MKAIMLALGLILTGCQLANLAGAGTIVPPGSSSEQVAFTEVAGGGMSGVNEPGGRVIKNLTEWQTLVGEVMGESTVASAVDFNKDMVIAVYAGEKPSGGYAIQVKRIELSPTEIVVSAKVIAPNPGDATITVLTSPFQWVKVHRSDLPVRFRFE